jgi:hypothetical protein
MFVYFPPFIFYFDFLLHLQKINVANDRHKLGCEYKEGKCYISKFIFKAKKNFEKRIPNLKIKGNKGNLGGKSHGKREFPYYG